MEDLLTESDAPAPAGTTFFDTQLGFAVRRECAPVLDLPPFAVPEDYVARRADLGAAEVNRRLLRAAGIGTYVIETGHRSDEILTPEQMAEVTGAGHAEVVRLEVIAEQVAARVEPADFPAAYRAALDDALRTAVGVKTIAAYRGGLDLDPERPTDDEVVAAVAAWTRCAEGPLRLTDPVLVRFGWWEAVDRQAVVQVHVGYGDPDVDLHRCNPLLMTELFRRTRGTGVRFALLHCYPYHREAGYLAHVFEHVYCDVGLAVNFTGAQSPQVVAESLELTPFHKALFSSDAFGAAELYHLGALLFRRGLGQALSEWGRTAGWPTEEQLRVARMVGSENARRLYRLENPTTGG
ncbi:amidohydrolase [Kytococcus schroeteri]|uniref:Amidohydrolase n=2 Tax=Kytococcus schroeteri TaxID=138300 RepID=A0A2I1PB22_9MICO|nr:amidohydrolase [Kytococcus schroeteri]